MQPPTIVLTLLFTMTLSCQSNGQTGLPDDITGVFEELPSNLSHMVRIADAKEPGERIRITGVVFESDGRTPAKNVLMYFYHTDAKGIYAKRGNEPRNSLAWWHGYNRGFLRTNDEGMYEINTIKPAPYPAAVEPAHIHVVVKAPSQKRVYDLGAITFAGDVLATPEYWYKVEQHGHPRDGGTQLTRNRTGILEGKRNFALYPQYDTEPRHSGILIGESCPTFTPQHISGPDKGTSVCPMCKYGYKTGVMAWVNSDDWSAHTILAKFLDKTISKQGGEAFRAFIIYMNPGNLTKEQAYSHWNRLVADAGVRHVGILYLSPAYKQKAFDVYRLNADKEIKNTVFLYKRRYVTHKFINLDPASVGLAEITRSVHTIVR